MPRDAHFGGHIRLAKWLLFKKGKPLAPDLDRYAAQRDESLNRGPVLVPWPRYGENV